MIVFEIIYEQQRPILTLIEARYGRIRINETPKPAQYVCQDYDEIADNPELRAIDRLMREIPRRR